MDLIFYRKWRKIEERVKGVTRMGLDVVIRTFVIGYIIGMLLRGTKTIHKEEGIPWIGSAITAIIRNIKKVINYIKKC